MLGLYRVLCAGAEYLWGNTLQTVGYFGKGRHYKKGVEVFHLGCNTNYSNNSSFCFFLSTIYDVLICQLLCGCQNEPLMIFQIANCNRNAMTIVFQYYFKINYATELIGYINVKLLL